MKRKYCAKFKAGNAERAGPPLARIVTERLKQSNEEGEEQRAKGEEQRQGKRGRN
jgi:hypothetical protein